MSVFLQMSANHGDTEGLFRAGIMSSGSSIPTGDIDNSDMQDSHPPSNRPGVPPSSSTCRNVGELMDRSR